MIREFDYYSNESHNCLVICPYCHSAYQAEAGDYSKEVREEKCQNCRHTFIRWDEFEVTYYTKKKK